MTGNKHQEFQEEIEEQPQESNESIQRSNTIRYIMFQCGVFWIVGSMNVTYLSSPYLFRKAHLYRLGEINLFIRYLFVIPGSLLAPVLISKFRFKRSFLTFIFSLFLITMAGLLTSLCNSGYKFGYWDKVYLYIINILIFAIGGIFGPAYFISMLCYTEMLANKNTISIFSHFSAGLSLASRLLPPHIHSPLMFV